MILKGTYRGIRVRLKGSEALLERVPGGYRAQFDRLVHKEAYGWWFFPVNDFVEHVRPCSS